MVTTQRSGPPSAAPAVIISPTCSKVVGELSLRATTTTPAAFTVRSAAAASGVIRPPSMMTAISFSEIVRNSPARSANHRAIPRAPVGLEVEGMTCRFSNSTSWEWSIRLLLSTGRPDATNEADPGVNWIPRWWLIDPPAGSASMSSTSRPVEAQWAARYRAVVDAPGEPWAL